LPDREERKLFTELFGNDVGEHYNQLSRAGFRRSHHIAYTPACPNCNECKPARIVIKDFKPSRSHRRIINKNNYLTAKAQPPKANEEQYALFAQYVSSRHGDGEMAGMGLSDYRFLVEETAVKTIVMEYRDKDECLVAACLTDVLDDGLSAVYSYFTPELERNGLGNYMVLHLVEEARLRGLPYVYLGYWISGSPKMSYKTRYKPLEVFSDGQWRLLEA